MDALAAEMARELTEGARSERPVRPVVTALAELAARYEIPMLWVELPMPERHAKHVGQHPNTLRIRAELARLAGQRGGAFERFEDPSWRDAGLFIDHLHLGPDGARKFSAELAERVARQPAFAGGPSVPAPAKPR
jgi:hypothetical protein